MAPLVGAVSTGAALLTVTVIAADWVVLHPLPLQSAAVHACEAPFGRPHVGHWVVALPDATVTGEPKGVTSRKN